MVLGMEEFLVTLARPRAGLVLPAGAAAEAEAVMAAKLHRLLEFCLAVCARATRTRRWSRGRT